jgi:SAM-dependent methyltransferase
VPSETAKHVITEKYLGSDYLSQNKSWDLEDSPWKAARVHQMLQILIQSLNLEPKSICDLGCGAGRVLSTLRENYPDAKLAGFDIAPDAAKFWPELAAQKLELQVADFTKIKTENFDVMLLLDVLEHLPDPHAFLAQVQNRAEYFIFHFPLDLSALSVLRETPLLKVRRSVGHIHSFTKNLALELLIECGFEILHAQFSEAYWNSPSVSLKTKMFAWPRRLLSLFSAEFSARLLGGQTLFVAARVRK